MDISTFLASKYYFSKSSKSFVNVISATAIAIIALMVIAEVLVLSVFNGFSRELQNIHKSFDCDIQLVPATGKVFELNGDTYRKIKELDEVKAVTRVIEDNAILDFSGKQEVVRFKGVEQNFFDQNEIAQRIVFGSENIFEDIPQMLVGYGVAQKFSLSTNNSVQFARVMYPNRNKKHLSKSMNSYQTELLNTRGIFQIEMEYDQQYIIFPIKHARILTQYVGEEISHLEIALKEGEDIDKLTEKISYLIPENTKLVTRYERHESIYKTINVEKVMTYFIFALILLIASLNLYAAMTLLIVNKKNDISTLDTLGLSFYGIRKIFFIEGLMVIGTGIITGAILSVILVVLQDKVGLIKIYANGSLFEYVPVKLELTDFVLCLILTFGVSLLMIIKPTLSSTKSLKVSGN